MVEICAKHEKRLGLWIGEKPCFPCIWQEKPRSSRAPASPVQGAYPPAVTNFQKSVTAGLWTPKAFATCSPAGAIRRLPRCGRGGIGRRAALRSLWGNPWKFESSRPHQKRTRPSSRVFCCRDFNDFSVGITGNVAVDAERCDEVLHVIDALHTQDLELDHPALLRRVDRAAQSHDMSVHMDVEAGEEGVI